MTDSTIILRVVSDTQDSFILLLTELALAFGVLGTGLGVFNLVRKRAPWPLKGAPKKKKPDKELAEYAKKEKDSDGPFTTGLKEESGDPKWSKKKS